MVDTLVYLTKLEELLLERDGRSTTLGAFNNENLSTQQLLEDLFQHSHIAK